MRYWRQFLRFLVSLQLLPILESGEETLVGGQAVVEGVMMRSPHAWGIAIRKPSGEITTHCEALQRPSEKHKWMGWPFVRGLATLGQAMRLGFVASKFSLNVGLESVAQEEGEKKPEISGWFMAVNMVLSIGFFIFMYKFVPLAAATGLKKHWAVLNGNFAFNLVDGIIRIGLFLLFVWGISLFKDIKRIYHYHGGEHKTVFAFEDHGMPSIEQAQQYSTYHPRCGTSFLMTIMLICIFVYAAFPVQGFWAKFALRIAFLPVIASVSYELIRFSAKHGKSVFALLTKPGLWLQRITTQPPSDDQVECAIKALDLAMDLEKKNGGELVIA
ncbi:MAG TPA: DUF1385 domain-containing protein [Candidatus Angelobacter sp.]|jgi:uncharacterized protein YqhQ|nr:DUF1385 domain-containing protein [Candidatus Angelobacter sp.]